jgi:protein-disulfide isomerase
MISAKAFLRFTRPVALMTVAALMASCAPEGGDGGKTDVKVTPYVEDVVMGDPSAKITIVEYASLTCSHCRDFWKQVMPGLRSAYIDTGKVKYVMRDFPTPPAEVAAAATAIARCKGAEGYYDVVEDVYSNYHELMQAAQGPQGAGPVLVAIGGRHGLSPDEVRACANSPETKAFIEKTVLDAQDKVRATPTIFIDDVLIEDHSIEGLSAAIEARLNPSGAAPQSPAAP